MWRHGRSDVLLLLVCLEASFASLTAAMSEHKVRSLAKVLPKSAVAQPCRPDYRISKLFFNDHFLTIWVLIFNSDCFGMPCVELQPPNPSLQKITSLLSFLN